MGAENVHFFVALVFLQQKMPLPGIKPLFFLGSMKTMLLSLLSPSHIKNYLGGPTAGGYCPIGSSYQQPCPQGTYNNFSGAADPADCSNCPPGFYCSGTSNPAPTGPCEAGFFCPGGASTSTQNRTQSGYYAPVGAAVQYPCPPGQYNNEARNIPFTCRYPPLSLSMPRSRQDVVLVAHTTVRKWYRIYRPCSDNTTVFPTLRDRGGENDREEEREREGEGGREGGREGLVLIGMRIPWICCGLH